MSTQTTVRTVALAATITASIALGAFWNAGIATAPTVEAPAPAAQTISVTAPAELEARDTYTVTPAPVVISVPEQYSAPEYVETHEYTAPVTAEDGTQVDESFYTLPACEYEDSDNCFWDATTMGNGSGSSFTVIDGVYTYWSN